MQPIIEKWEAGLRVSRIVVNNLDFDPLDISNHLINP
jgi:hypothetical protein